MIFGIGIDILKISRIEKILNKYGKNFLKKVFTDIEIKKILVLFIKKINLLNLLQQKKLLLKL